MQSLFSKLTRMWPHEHRHNPVKEKIKQKPFFYDLLNQHKNIVESDMKADVK